ncbi:MAG: 50S ribosomal protein L13 [Parcubacteria group bacterium]|jgi:large subunit ribosomal protein L13
MPEKTPKNNKITRDYYLFDCKDANLGRIGTKASFILQGKHKADFRPNFDGGDFAVIINANALRTSANKTLSKVYYSFSGYPGGIRAKKLGEYLEKDPEKVISWAVYGMLPKNKLRSERMKRLLIFKDEKHGFKQELKQIKP